jgi:hypothetical protein
MSEDNDWNYSIGSVTRLIGTALMTPVTTRVLQARLSPASGISILDHQQRRVLTAVAARLLPQEDRAEPIELVDTFDRLLASGAGDGWRYADLPDDAAMIEQGLVATDALAMARHGAEFAALPSNAQDVLLHDIQSELFANDEWPTTSASLWFEELLAGLVEIYYAHPFAAEEIGYAGMADAQGWQTIGPGDRAAHEPEATSR